MSAIIDHNASAHDQVRMHFLYRQLKPPPRTALLKNNQVLYRQGEILSSIYWIQQGHIKLSRNNRRGDEYIKAILPYGEFIGLAGDSASGMASETASAKGKTILTVFSKTDFMALLQTEPVVLNGYVGSLTNRSEFLDRRCERMALTDLSVRVAGMVFDLANCYGRACRHGHMVDFRMTQEELASLVGASRQAVSSVLNRFKKHGLLSYTRSYICIDDWSALKKMIEC